MPTTLDQLIHEVEDRTPDGDVLDRLADAAATASTLDDLADHLLGHFVDQARGAGASWAQIGGHLGVTRQAAHQRFVAGETSTETFTNRATITLLQAQNAARDRGAEETTTQHLVLGLLAEWPGIAGQALEAVGITRDALQAAIEATLPATRPASAAHRPLSVGLRRTLELARRRGLRRGEDYVGTEHLLLGLADSGDEPTLGVLTELADREDLAAALETAIDAALAQWRSARVGAAGE